MRSRTLRALGISLVLLPGFIAAEVSAQYIPSIFSAEPKWAASIFHQVLVDDPGLFGGRREPDVELTGIRLRRNLTERLGLEATAARFTGSGRHYGSGLAYYSVSLYHTLMPMSAESGVNFAAGYEIGLMEFERFEVAPSLHAQGWGIMRIVGDADRSFSLGARIGGWYNRWIGGGRSTDLDFALDSTLIFEWFYVRSEYARGNATFDTRLFSILEAGVRW